MKIRLRFAEAATHKESLVAEAKRLREKAKSLPLGADREGLRKARLDETKADIDEWLNSAGLKPPT